MGQAPSGHVWVRGRDEKPGEYHLAADVWRAVSASDVDKRRREWLEARADAVATSRREQAHSPKVPARECQGATESPGDSPARESKDGQEEHARNAVTNKDEAGHANKAATDADQAAAAQRATYKRAK